MLGTGTQKNIYLPGVTTALKSGGALAYSSNELTVDIASLSDISSVDGASDELLIYDTNTAKMSKLHNNANIICFGARTLDFETTILLINKFINTDFEGGRHERRLKKIESNI